MHDENMFRGDPGRREISRMFRDRQDVIQDCNRDGQLVQ